MEGDVFLTVIVQMPPSETSDAVMTAVSCVLLTYWVVRDDPLQRTVDPLLKFEPFTVSEKLPFPAEMFAGEMELITGVESGDGEDCPPQPVRKKERQAIRAPTANGRIDSERSGYLH